MRTEIQAAYGISLPRIPGKRVRFLEEDGSSGVTVEVFANGSEFPEWSAERSRIELAVTAVLKKYSEGPSTEAENV